jgi:hypothetical protein
LDFFFFFFFFLLFFLFFNAPKTAIREAAEVEERERMEVPVLDEGGPIPMEFEEQLFSQPGAGSFFGGVPFSQPGASEAGAREEDDDAAHAMDEDDELHFEVWFAL